MDALLADDLGLVHFLHRVDLLVLLGPHAPDLAEAALADHVLAVEVLAGDLLAVEVDGGGRVLGLQFGEVDLEAVLDVLVGLLADGRVAPVVLLLSLGVDLLALPRLLVEVRAAGHDHSVAAAHALLTI